MGAFFSRPKETDYDTLLAKLQTQIAARQARLQQIRLRERRANALLITYGLACWLLYTVLWYFHIVGARDGPWPTMAAGAAPVVIGPVAIIFTRRASRWFYHRKEAKEETQLKVLVKQKQDKVEEIKKKTGYYSTRDLLEKYDEALRKGPASNPSTPVKAPVSGGPKSAAQVPVGTPATPQGAAAARMGSPAAAMTTPLRDGANARAPGTPVQVPFPGAGGAPGVALPPMPFPPSTPPPRTLLDKVADALLGVSPEETNPMHRYALICGQCYAHNGLAKKDEFDFVQYRCPRCGYFNPPRRTPGSATLAAGDPHRHRRVVSEVGPSPLTASWAQPGRQEDGEPAGETSERDDGPDPLAEGANAGSGTTAREQGGATLRRRAAKQEARKLREEAPDEEAEDQMDLTE